MKITKSYCLQQYNKLSKHFEELHIKLSQPIFIIHRLPDDAYAFTETFKSDDGFTPIIVLSLNAHKTKTELTDTLLHEMTHIALSMKRYDQEEKLDHDNRFRKLFQKINRVYNKGEK